MPKTYAKPAVSSGGVRLVTGTYTGDGVAGGQTITIGYAPKFIFVFSRVVGLGGDSSSPAMKASNDATGTIVNQRGWFHVYFSPDGSFTADGFVADGGPSNLFNILGIDYTYFAFC